MSDTGWPARRARENSRIGDLAEARPVEGAGERIGCGDGACRHIGAVLVQQQEPERAREHRDVAGEVKAGLEEGRRGEAARRLRRERRADAADVAGEGRDREREHHHRARRRTRGRVKLEGDRREHEEQGAEDDAAEHGRARRIADHEGEGRRDAGDDRRMHPGRKVAAIEREKGGCLERHRKAEQRRPTTMAPFCGAPRTAKSAKASACATSEKHHRARSSRRRRPVPIHSNRREQQIRDEQDGEERAQVEHVSASVGPWRASRRTSGP
jgi:hypothetical protein